MNEEQFWANVQRGASDNCWPWTAGENGNGRGRLLFEGRFQYAYRVAWQLTHGEQIPDGMMACHSCDNPSMKREDMKAAAKFRVTCATCGTQQARATTDVTAANWMIQHESEHRARAVDS